MGIDLICIFLVRIELIEYIWRGLKREGNIGARERVDCKINDVFAPHMQPSGSRKP